MGRVSGHDAQYQVQSNLIYNLHFSARESAIRSSLKPELLETSAFLPVVVWSKELQFDTLSEIIQRELQNRVSLAFWGYSSCNISLFATDCLQVVFSTV